VNFSVTEVGSILPKFAGDLYAPLAASFCGNPTCVVDASCYAGANSTKDAIAKIEWIAGPYIYTCTGGLLNDNNPNQSNFFLTANHCISKSNNASNAQFYWRFRTASCNGSCPSNSGWPYKTTGSTISTTGRRGDFTLLHLNANPPAGSVLLGWTNAPVANTNGAALHRVSNPNFGPQVYSEHSVSTSAPTCQGWPRGERIYSKDTLGAIDGGSSGSPVVNASNQVVGQLSGTCGTNPGNPCDSVSNATVDGAFAYYYSSVQPFLNP
jgi:V8-like Glu-specific endopeptidase